MGTFHKETKHGEIDRCVLLPGGDPARAGYIADQYFFDVVCADQ